MGDAGTILTSTGGVGWTPRDAPFASQLFDAAAGAGGYVIGGQFGAIFGSPDAITWTNPTAPVSITWLSANSSDGRFLLTDRRASC